MAVKPIPEGYHTVTPYLAVDDAAAAIEYYKQGVRRDRSAGAWRRRTARSATPSSQIGDSLVMLSDPFPQASTRPPSELGGTSASVFLYVEDVDAVVKQAVDEGATIDDGGRRPVLGRPLRHRHRPVRPRVVDRDARRGRPARGDGGAGQGGHGRDEQLGENRVRARPLSHDAPAEIFTDGAHGRRRPRLGDSAIITPRTNSLRGVDTALAAVELEGPTSTPHG